MARIRTIKPMFFTSEDVVTLDPLTRIFFIGLWTEADREGRLEWKPLSLKLRILPNDVEFNVEESARAMCANGLIDIYKCGNSTYCQINNFHKHQLINSREPQSAIPENPVDSEVYCKPSDEALNNKQACEDAAHNNERHVHAHESTSGKGKGKGKGIDNNIALFHNKPVLFDEFYQAYPNKKDKKRAKTAFEKINLDKIPIEKIMTGLRNQIQWRANHPPGAFLPEWKHPATWLNGENWDDELEDPQSKISNSPAPYQNDQHMIDKAFEDNEWANNLDEVL